MPMDVFLCSLALGIFMTVAGVSAQSCGDPGYVLNGRRLGNPFTYAKNVEFECREGYRLRGLKTRYCETGGKWNGELPICEPIYCPIPTDPVNGQVWASSLDYGTELHYKCNEGFLLQNHKPRNCTENGTWSHNEPECIAVKSSETITTNFGSTNGTPESWSTNLSSLDVDECFCTYDYRTDLLTAYVGNRELEGEARIKTSENITFYCKHNGMDIVWPNGLRIFDRVVLTCNTCHEWRLFDLPHCEARQPGDSLVVYNSRMKFLPRGIIEVPRSGSIAIQCRNPWDQPRWYAGGKKGIRYFQNVQRVQLQTGVYAHYIVISRLNDEHSGSYECYATDHNGLRYRATKMDLQIAEAEVRCPELQTNTDKGSFSIVYENERRINSRARYACKDSSKQLVGTRERTCLNDGKWSGSYPSCDEAEVRCPELQTNTDKGSFSIVYENERRINSRARYTCIDSSKQLVGARDRICLKDGKWSGSYPSCDDIRCPFLNEDNVFSIYYTNSRKVNSAALYYCKSNKQRLIGSSNRTCLSTGQWSDTDPVCEDILCLEFPTYNGLLVRYSNGLKVNSIATFGCSYSSTLVGSAESRCRFNGTWSNPRPSCENSVTCERFSNSPGVEVTYSRDVRVGSVASFECAGLTTLNGSSTASCRSDGTWSHSLPSCNLPKCSIDTLMKSLPEGVVADLSDVTGGFHDLGSNVKLQCEENFILTGTLVATCGIRGKWDYGNVQCVPGCRLHKDISPHLIIFPVKDYYRFGDFILLSCPPGKILSSKIERVMCLQKDWSDPIPGCTE